MSASQRPRIAVIIPSFGDGGVERMMVNLARGFAGHGVAVDFLIKESKAPYINALGDKVELLQLPSESDRATRGALADYLDQRRPNVMLTAKGKDDRLALAAKAETGAAARLFIRAGTHLSTRLAKRYRNPIDLWLTKRRWRKQYLDADGIICVSQGVARDVAGLTGLPTSTLHVLRNPVVTPELDTLAAQPAAHPWLAEGQQPTILGAGGLRRQKNFSLLLRAFARVREQRDCRLIVIGEGRQRPRLEKLARKLGIAGDVDLPGFCANPYSYMRRAALFALSSDWEGSPNVLTEALAVGTTVVSTDCPSGPREILQDGRFGELVPKGDERLLAKALLSSLAHPQPAGELRAAVSEYTLERSSAGYLRAFGLAGAT